MSKKLLLYPFGGSAREALATIVDINQIKAEWDVCGFIDDDPSKLGKDCCGVKVLGGGETLKDFPDAYILAVPGHPDTYLKRQEFIDRLKVEASRFAQIIHPTVALAPDAQIGYNTLLMPHVMVSCGTSIGNHCVILPNTTISHDSVIGDYCFVGSNVSISGTVIIKPNCYIGSGTRIINDITIHEKSLTGLGSNVIADVEKEVIVAGNPSKVIRKSTL